MKEFNLEEARAGKPVCTRSGKKARIVCFDRKDKRYPIIALLHEGEEEIINIYTIKGKYNDINEKNKHPKDLMMAPIKREGWINIYKTMFSQIYSLVYDTKKEALASRNENHVATVKVEWEE